MSRTLAVWICGIVATWIVAAPPAWAQTGAAKTAASAAPAGFPRHDISGTWTPEKEGSGIGGPGPYSAPSDGKHEPPYTAAAREKMKDYRPGNGLYQVAPPLINDPAVIYCDPQGVPRIDLYELRDTHITQEKEKTFIMYQPHVAGNLDGWARAAERSRSAMDGIFGRQMGRRCDVRRADERSGRTHVAR
jgi:hypothetical protein